MSVTAVDVERYRAAVDAEAAARRFVPGRPIAIPSDAWVACLGHADFHHWFGTKCDGRCPHLDYERAADAAPLPRARVVRR